MDRVRMELDEMGNLIISVGNGKGALTVMITDIAQKGSDYYYHNYTLTTSTGFKVHGCHWDVENAVEKQTNGKLLKTLMGMAVMFFEHNMPEIHEDDNGDNDEEDE